MAASKNLFATGDGVDPRPREPSYSLLIERGGRSSSGCATRVSAARKQLGILATERLVLKEVLTQ